MLTKIHIENFRSIRDAEFSTSPLCALIGKNNSGKSNVLHAIDMVLGDRWPSTRTFSQEDVFGYDPDRDIVISLWFATPWEVRGDIGDPVEATGVRFTLTKYQRASGRHRKGDLRATFHSIDAEGEVIKVLRRTPKSPRPFPTEANVSADVRDSLAAVLIDVDRNAARHLSGSRWSILGRLLLDVAKDLRADADRFAEFQKRFAGAQEVLRTPSFNRLQELVVENLQSQTGLADIEVQLDQVDPLNLYKSFSVLFKDSESPEPVGADRMGSGIQSAVVVALLQAYREIKKDQAILLFEEPELFLHPHARRHLYALLRSLADDGTQVIYTTHSQDFVDLERVDCVRLVTNTLEDGTKVEAPTTGALRANARKRLKFIRHFGAPRNEIFFAESVVLVEGVTELGALGVLTDLVPGGLNLDQTSCSVIEVNGKDNLPMFMRMVQALGKRCLVVYDTDSHHEGPALENTQRRNKKIQECADASVTLHQCDPYFEVAAGVPGESQSNKEGNAREHLASFESWDDIPAPLQSLLWAVKNHSENRDRPQPNQGIWTPPAIEG